MEQRDRGTQSCSGKGLFCLGFVKAEECETQERLDVRSSQRWQSSNWTFWLCAMHNRNHVNGLGGWGRRDLCFSKVQNILDHNQEFGLEGESTVTLDSVQSPGGRLLTSAGDFCSE